MKICAAACIGCISLACSADDVPPAEPKALQRFLASGAYKTWAKEGALHTSAGPHPVQVRTYLNPAVRASLQAGNMSHPAGSATVKELFDAEDRLRGWAVAVKTEADAPHGRGWYWYETFSIKADAKPAYAGQGLPLCVGCHAPGRDFVLTPFPLR